MKLSDFGTAKYIDSDIGQSEEAKLFASEIYYYLGLTKLIKSNDYLIENKFDDSNLNSYFMFSPSSLNIF